MKCEHINQDNDWATAPPPEDIEAQLRLGFKKAACQLELARHAEKLQTGCRIQGYFNSTSSRRTFYYAMCLAAYDNQLYTTKKLSEMLGISRQAITTMSKECLEEGWIIPSDRCKKCYQASKTLLVFDEQATDRRLERILNLRRQSMFSSYVDYMEMTQEIRQTT